MSEETKELEVEDAPAAPKDLKIEDIASLLRPWAKQLVTVGQVYMHRYPPATTNPEVIEAVTVPVPLSAYYALLGALAIIMRDGKK